jgi:arylsulfatase A-like enzyme
LRYCSPADLARCNPNLSRYASIEAQSQPYRERSLARVADSKPNILFVLADDMEAADLEHMLKTQSLLVDQGVKFTRPWVSRSPYCPSRATLLRGQYAHNHKVWVDVESSGTSGASWIRGSRARR